MRIPEPQLSELLSLLRELLDIIDRARSAHDALLDAYGENNQTLVTLEELAIIRESGQEHYRRINALMLNVARLDAIRGAATMKALLDVLAEVSLRIEPLRQSIREVKNEWRLP